MSLSRPLSFVLTSLLALALATSALTATAQPPAQDTGDPAGPFLATPPLTPETFADPPASVRPGTRWWWDDLIGTLGGPSYAFNLDDALEEVDAFADAGFGRFEIAWRGDDYGTEAQQGNLLAVAERAADHGLQLDMTLGPGWPWASPDTTGELGQQELIYGREDVTGPSTFDGPLPDPIDERDQTPLDQPLPRVLEAATAARVLERGPAAEVDSPPESSTVLDPDSLVDLTAFVGEDGTLTWDVPEGDWIVFAFWRRHRSGSFVSLIDEKSVEAGLAYVDGNQLGAAEPAVREVGYSFFEDSLELHADELYWAPDMAEEFTARRGYDMAKYLPLMFVQTVSEYWVPQDEPVPDFELPEGEGARYRHDYYETITDLYIDDHMVVVADWAQQYGMQFRTQAAYGNNFEVIRSAREATEAGVLIDDESLNAGDTPFLIGQGTFFPDASYDDVDGQTWRFAMDHYRQVVSGTHQGGGTELTSELGAWFGLELHMFLREYKRMMDKEWAMGMTRPLLHGYTHSPADAPWPGYSHFIGLVGEAVNFRTWPEWQLLRPLSDYWARGALVLQQQTPKTDLAILRDSFVTTSAGDLAPRDFFFDAASMERAGYSIGYVDPVGLVDHPAGTDGTLFPDGPGYRALVVDTDLFYVDNGRLQGDAAEAIDAASAAGLAVVFVGDPPSKGIRGLDPAEEDQRVADAMAAILARPTTRQVPAQTDVLGALTDLGVRPDAEWNQPVPVYAQRRSTADGEVYLLWNATADPQSFTGSFLADGAPTELDLWEGEFRPVATYTAAGDRVAVPLTLAPHDVRVLRFDPADRRGHLTSTSADEAVVIGPRTAELRDADGGAVAATRSDGTATEVVLPEITDEPLEISGLGAWTLQVDTYGPEGVVSRPGVPLTGLADWRTIPGLTNQSGIGTYTTTVSLPEGWVADDRGTQLDLGAHDGAVQVSVNGQVVTANIDPTAPLDVTGLLEPGDNTIEVVLATTPFNRAAVSPGTVVTRPLFPTSLEGETQAYGLRGPVRLVPFARGEVELPERVGPTVTRHGGADRIATAVEIARVAGRTGATVVLATAADYPDALAAVPLAAHLDAPLLLTDPSGLSPATAAEMVRLGTTRVVVIGGPAAVGLGVTADLDAAGIGWERLAGENRFATAGLVADSLPATGRVTLVEGEHADPDRGWPDALTAGALPDPILLVTADRLPASTAERLSTDTDVRIVGGPAAVRDGVAAAVDALAGDVRRLAGPTRYTTSIAGADAAVADGASTSTVWLSTGHNWPDGLSAGAADGLVLLIDGDDPDGATPVLEWLGERAAGIDHVRLAGGTAALSVAVEQAVAAAVG